MATVETKPMTAEEFAEWVNRPENHDRYFELVRGEIIEMPPPMKYHGFVCGNSARIMGNFAAQRRKGYVCTNDSGVIIERDPDTVRGPDVTFYEDHQSAENIERAYAVIPPRVAIEVLSPNDRINQVMKRVSDLLRSGVQLVWVVDPEVREVGVYRPGKEPYVLTEHQELTGEDVLPDFRCKVADFFAVPGQLP